MGRSQNYVGIDIASQSFTVSLGKAEPGWNLAGKATQFDNQYEGYGQLLGWLHAQKATPKGTMICMESTGVYGEQLAYFLKINGYRVCIEAPLKVKRAFDPEGHKSDPVDSQQIAEYAYRFWDELKDWDARPEVFEQIKVLLSTREQCLEDRIAHENTLKALQRKQIRVYSAERCHQSLITELQNMIERIEVEIQSLIDQHPDLKVKQKNLKSIPGVGPLLADHILLICQQTEQPLSHKRLAAFIGICPYEHSSGSSVKRKPRSRGYGPSALRKLLFLAAMSNSTHNPAFHAYFERKKLEGKPGKVALNNIANRLVKIMVAIYQSDVPFIPGYRSINPVLLTKS